MRCSDSGACPGTERVYVYGKPLSRADIICIGNRNWDPRRGTLSDPEPCGRRRIS